MNLNKVRVFIVTVDKLTVDTGPSTNMKTIFTYVKGDIFSYNKYYYTSDYEYLSYESDSEESRFISSCDLESNIDFCI